MELNDMYWNWNSWNYGSYFQVYTRINKLVIKYTFKYVKYKPVIEIQYIEIHKCWQALVQSSSPEVCKSPIKILELHIGTQRYHSSTNKS